MSEDGRAQLKTDAEVERLRARVAELERVEEALRDSEAKFHLLADSTHDWVYWLDDDGHFVYSSPSCERITGYAAEDFVGNPALLLQIIHPDDRARMADHMKVFQGSPDDGMMDFKILCRDGAVRWIGHVCRPILDAEARCLGRRSSNRDITDRKRIEAALRESEERSRATLYSIGDGVTATDAAGRVTRMNPVAEALTGWPEAEAVGRPLAEVFRIVNEDTRAEVEGPVARVLREGTVVGLANHTLLVARDGTERPVADSGAPIRDAQGAITGVVLVFRDRTEERAAQRRYQELFDNVAVALLRSTPGPEGTLVDVNPAMVRMFEADSREQLMAVRPSDLYLDASQRQIVGDVIAATGRIDAEVRFKTLKGKPIWCHITSLKTTAADGQVCFDNTMEDITERKRMETALRESEERNRATLYSIGDGVIATDAAGRVARMNPVAEALTGWPEAAAVGRPLTEVFRIINEHTRAEVESPVARVLREGTVVGLANHTLLIAKDGTERPIADSGAPIHDAQGAIAGVVLVFRDRTEERRAERALRESERKFRDTVRNLDEGYYSCEMDGLLLEHNVAFNRMLGFDAAQDLKGSKLPDFWERPDDRNAYLTELMATGVVHNYLIDAKTIGGGKLVVMANSHLMKDDQGRPVRIEGTFADFTERRWMEEELRRHRDELEMLVQRRTQQLAESEQRLTKEIAAVADIVGEMLSGELTDAEVERQVLNACLDATRSTHGMIGVVNQHGRYDVTAYNSRTLSDCAFPEALAWEMTTGMEIRGIWGWPMLHGQPLVCNDLPTHPARVGQPQGHVPIESFLGVPVKRAGEVIGMVAVANKPGGFTEADAATLGRLVDVMVVSRQHRELLTELELLVRDRTARLEESNKELEAFSYSVSHDLRAPLRAVDGFTRILVKEYEPRLNHEGKRLCFVIRENTRRMAQLIDDLLAFSRLGRVEMNLSPIDMGAMATALFYEVTTPESRERIDFQVGAVPPATGDPTLMRQAWLNLLSNAVKFSSKLARAVIEVRGEQQEGEAVYSITDNGAGFDMQYVHKLFGVFQRLHSTSEFEGTGVGLALVQRVVRRHGGRVWAEGEIDRGATFHFALPQKGA